MINLTLNQIKEKIASEKQISEADIDSKIKKKLEELSGLISEEGAAHIVANELGVNLMKSEAGLVKIGSLIPGMKDVEIAGRVIRKYDVRVFQRETGEGKVGKILVGDESGITMVTLWNDKADWMTDLNEQDIIKITSLNIRDNNGRSEAHAGEGSKLEKNPKGVEIQSRPQQNAELVKKKISDLTEQDSNAEIFVTIVQVFDPKFFEPRNEGEKAGAVLNLFVDDGSDNIRTVFWKEQILGLLNITEDKLLVFKDKPETFEDVKSDLLGRMVKLIGRVSKNKVLGRLEFVVNKSILEVDPEKEFENIPEETKKEVVVETEPLKKKESSDDLDDLEEEVLNLEDLDDL
jgi:hypothetical protein